tara:strand:- start:607 stop:831 length:225 start_codon:yes stop_codon:yes gene_type:complete
LDNYQFRVLSHHIEPHRPTVVYRHRHGRPVAFDQARPVVADYVLVRAPPIPERQMEFYGLSVLFLNILFLRLLV